MLFDEEGFLFDQASSPDEVALVNYAKLVGLPLVDRTLSHITVQRPRGTKVCVF